MNEYYKYDSIKFRKEITLGEDKKLLKLVMNNLSVYQKLPKINKNELIKYNLNNKVIIMNNKK